MKVHDSNHHIKKYINYHEKCKNMEKIRLFYVIRSHFNLFAIINDEVSKSSIYHICQNVLINHKLQTKIKTLKYYSNCLLAGFPTYVIQYKYFIK